MSIKLFERKLNQSLALAFFLGLTINTPMPVQAQITELEPSLSQRALELNNTVVILPESYNDSDGMDYPILFLMPFTGGTPTDLFNWYFSELYQINTASQHIVVLPLADTAGKVEDIANPAAVERYENIVTASLASLRSRYKVDSSRIAIAGWSLGGDLAWAIALRNPSIFQGVMIVGSRSINPRPSRVPQVISELASNDVRFFMAMGEEDKRLSDMRSSVDALAAYGVNHRFEIIPNADHGDAFNAYAQREVQELSQQGIEYLFLRD
ncbi:MAG: prolyl oligopeptidase family serine peptidase [Cyanobacteria bacterium J06649_11]